MTDEQRSYQQNLSGNGPEMARKWPGNGSEMGKALPEEGHFEIQENPRDEQAFKRCSSSLSWFVLSLYYRAKHGMTSA